MSSSLDTVLTVAGFVVIFAGVALVVSLMPFAMLNADAVYGSSPAIQHYLLIAGVFVPPLTVIGVYVAGVVCAWRSAGTTFYYPWVTLAIGAAGWAAVSWVITVWFENAGSKPNPKRRDHLKPYAVADTICCLRPDEIGSELDGKLLDDRIGRPGRVSLTPHQTSRRRRALTPSMFDRDYRTFKARAKYGLPPGWTIEKSKVPPWFGMPGGAIQYVFLSPEDETASLEPLIEWGFLEEIRQR